MTLDAAKFIEVDAEVRYWEDAILNGVEDTEGRTPLRKGDSWIAIIDLTTGAVTNWPEGNETVVHYKVCDAGLYWLQDETGKRIAKWSSHYVPAEVLCRGRAIDSDYIILEIGKDGKIVDWTTPYLDDERWKRMEPATEY